MRQEIQKEIPDQQKKEEGQGLAQFNFDDWLASRDKTGLMGINYDRDGNVEEKDEVRESLSQSSINNDVKVSNMSNLGAHQ
jgi:hypothetical protein